MPQFQMIPGLNIEYPHLLMMTGFKVVHPPVRHIKFQIAENSVDIDGVIQCAGEVTIGDAYPAPAIGDMQCVIRHGGTASPGGDNTIFYGACVACLKQEAHTGGVMQGNT